MEKANFGDFCAKLADDLPEYESTVDADDEIEQGKGHTVLPRLVRSPRLVRLPV